MSAEGGFKIYLDDKFYGSFSYSRACSVLSELECMYPDSSILVEAFL